MKLKVTWPLFPLPVLEDMNAEDSRSHDNQQTEGHRTHGATDQTTQPATEPHIQHPAPTNPHQHHHTQVGN